MKYAIFLIGLFFNFFQVNTAIAQNVTSQLRIMDILDGFVPNQYDSSSVEFGSPDKIVRWGQGDSGVASLTHIDIRGIKNTPVTVGSNPPAAQVQSER